MFSAAILGIDSANSIWWLKSIMQMMILCLLIPILLNSWKKLETTCWIIIGTCTTASLLIILSKLQILPFTLNQLTYGAAGINRQSGTSADPNYCAMQLLVGFSIALSFFIYKENASIRILLLPIMSILLLGILSTVSLGAIIGLLGLIILFFLLLIKPSFSKLLLFFAIFILIISVLASIPAIRLRINQEIVESSFLGIWRIGSARVLTWAASANLIIHKPLFGVGLGNHQYVLKDYDPFSIMKYLEQDEKVAHNMYLSFAADNGLPALFLLFFILTYLLIKTYKVIKSSHNYQHISIGIFSTLVCFLIQNLFLDGWSEKYLWVLMGLSTSIILRHLQIKDF
jgi:O-antigen ligase